MHEMLEYRNTPQHSCNVLFFLTVSCDADGKQLPGLWDFGVETIIRNKELWQTLVDIMQVNNFAEHRADALLSAGHNFNLVALEQSGRDAALEAAMLIGQLTASMSQSASEARDRPSRLKSGHLQLPAPELMDLATLLHCVRFQMCPTVIIWLLKQLRKCPWSPRLLLSDRSQANGTYLLHAENGCTHMGMSKHVCHASTDHQRMK